MAVLRYNPWNFDAEPGDIMVGHNGRAWRLYERQNGPSASAGELCMRELKKPGQIAKIVDDELVWVRAAKTAERADSNQLPHGETRKS